MTSADWLPRSVAFRRILAGNENKGTTSPTLSPIIMAERVKGARTITIKGNGYARTWPRVC